MGNAETQNPHSLLSRERRLLRSLLCVQIHESLSVG